MSDPGREILPVDEPGAGEDVVVLLRRQANLFSQLEGFAKRQRMLVVQEDTKPLLALLAERQKLSIELAYVSERLRPVRTSWNSYRSCLTDIQRDEADDLVKRMQMSLSRVIESDEEDARALSVRKQMVRRELQTSQTRSAAAGMYQSTAAPAGRRLDEEQ
ncbi:MAG: hypothetical protein ACKVX9_16265 [Blastocatellia bacterium]